MVEKLVPQLSTNSQTGEIVGDGLGLDQADLVIGGQNCEAHFVDPSNTNGGR